MLERMEHYKYRLKDKIKLKGYNFFRVIKGDFEKPDGIKIIWSVDGKEKIINPKNKF